VYSNLLVLSGRLYFCDLASVVKKLAKAEDYKNKAITILSKLERKRLNCIITKEEYADLLSGWPGRVYQTWPSAKWEETVPFLCAFIGTKVVDVGCNAGLYSYCLGKEAASVIGVEKDKHFVAQAKHTFSKIKAPNQLICSSFLEFAKRDDLDYDGLYIVGVLYYFTPEEVDLLVTRVLPRCKTVLLVSREDKKPKRWNNDLYKSKNIVPLLTSAGMDVEVLNPKGNFVSVLGRR